MRWNLFIMQKPRGEERTGGGGRGDISFSRQPGRQDIARSMQPKKKTNNPSFINSRLKQKQRGIEKKIPNYILWSWCECVSFFTVLTQLICFSVNPPHPPTHTNNSTITLHLARLSGSNRQYKKLFTLQGANATLSSILLPSHWFSHLCVDKQN